MRTKVLLCAALLACAACAKQATSTVGEKESRSDDPASTWTLKRSTSGIDGAVTIASQTIQPESDVAFLVEISCKERRRVPALSIQSLVGDPSAPDERSAIASTIALTGFVNEAVPVGRLRVAGKEPTSLSPFFRIDDAYANKMEVNGLFVRDVQFPMYVEVSNGAGQYEIHIEAGKEVDQVLQACGMPEAPPQTSEPNNVRHESASAEPSVVMSGQKSLNPSFSCMAASSRVEKLICADSRLSRLDSLMASNYRSMLAADLGGAQDDLKSTQRSWIGKRDACEDSLCLENAYATRLDEICQYPVASGVHPDCSGAEEVQ